MLYTLSLILIILIILQFCGHSDDNNTKLNSSDHRWIYRSQGYILGKYKGD